MDSPSRKSKEKEFNEFARQQAILSNKKDPSESPSIGFFRDYDHMGYDMQAITNANHRITITKTKEAKD